MRQTRTANRTPEEIARLRAVRERYQQEKPDPLQVLAEGGYDDFVPLGALLELHQALAWLKQERERQGLSLAQLSEMTGIDQGALSRLENARNTNPTYETISRVAAALGKVLRWSFVDVTPEEEIPTPVGGETVPA